MYVWSKSNMIYLHLLKLNSIGALNYIANGNNQDLSEINE